jgi:hypothetical protein
MVTLVAGDPATFASGAEPVLIDEFQHAIKAELNRDTRPGRFVITGSTRYDMLPRSAQSLTGRATVVPVWPLSPGELDQRQESFVETLLADPASLARRRRPAGQTGRSTWTGSSAAVSPCR